MRKFLLAGAATVAMTGAASAAGLEAIQHGATGTSSALRGTAAPGAMVVRFDVYQFFGAGFSSNTNDKATLAARAAVPGLMVNNTTGVTAQFTGTLPAGNTQIVAPVTAAPQRQAKVDPFGMMHTIRLFPGFDAQTQGGLRYGAHAQFRLNNNTGGVGGGVGTGGNRVTNTLFLDRAVMYVGGDSWGYVSFGTFPGVSGTMSTGTLEGLIADGGWNGWAPIFARTVNPYQFHTNIGTDRTQKIIYETPSWSGLRFGVSFAPSSASGQTGDGNTPNLGGAGRQATSPDAGDFNRYRNQFQVAGRYDGTLAGVGLVAQVSYTGSGVVGSSVAGAQTNRGQGIFGAGLQATYMGFTVGGRLETGTFNGGNNLSPRGQKQSTVWSLGAAYATGPYAVGLHYISASTNGVTTNTAQRFDTGIGFGARWDYAPGARVFLEGVVGTAKEAGVNLTLDATAPAGATRSANATAVIIGNSFRW